MSIYVESKRYLKHWVGVTKLPQNNASEVFQRIRKINTVNTNKQITANNKIKFKHYVLWAMNTNHICKSTIGSVSVCGFMQTVFQLALNLKKSN